MQSANPTRNLEQHFEAYSGWRQSLAAAVTDLKSWLQQQELSDTQVDQRLEHVLSTLRDDKLYVAFVAEFSRGKSELINAIFFATYGQRILPSSAGRTTMCPTEVMYEHGSEPSLRLLPIETRKTGTTITEFRGFPEEWQVLPLDTKSPDKMIQTLQHITEVKHVAREEAQTMGFHVAEEESQTGMRLAEDGLVEIPKWRHAIINIPHPLLEQGLVILDTPGLNALGAEPELTLNMLPSAHAVLFILAADAGVTKSDIDVWHDHIGVRKDSPNKGRLVVLNKIDGLWDELRDWNEVNREIDRQIRDTAKHLAIPEQNVFPVSAQKALLGKVKKDAKILERSRILALEQALGSEIVPAKREIVRDNISGDMEDVIKAMRLIISQRTKNVYEHMDELGGLSGKNMDVIEHMMKKVKADKEVFEKSLQRFQATRSIFSQQTNVLYTHLNLKNLDTLIAQTKKEMDTQPDHGRAHDLHGQFLQARAGDHGSGRQAGPGNQGHDGRRVQEIPGGARPRQHQAGRLLGHALPARDQAAAGPARPVHEGRVAGVHRAARADAQVLRILRGQGARHLQDGQPRRRQLAQDHHVADGIAGARAPGAIAPAARVHQAHSPGE